MQNTIVNASIPIKTIAVFSGFLGGWIAGGIVAIVALTIGTSLPINKNDVVYSFKIGLDGAGIRQGMPPLVGAGGKVPKIRIFDNLGRTIGKKTKQTLCKSGQELCVVTVRNVREQPAYALLRGRSDPMCMAAAAVTYPSGDHFAWTGNWAHTCGHAWYYSEIDAQHPNGTIKLDCVWLGSNGWRDGYATAIRVHWPRFTEGFTRRLPSEHYYCQANQSALAFFHNKGARYFDGNHVKGPDVVPNDTLAINPAAEVAYPAMRRRHIDSMHRRSVKSHFDQHSAKFLCEDATSYGPSLVSVAERTFCHMPDKVLYQFCDDVESGACWNVEEHKFDVKGHGQHALIARSALPDTEFYEPIVWK